MNALEDKLEAMMITKPDRKTKQGEKRANRFWYIRNRVQKAKYSAEYHKIHKDTINRTKAVNRGNDFTCSPLNNGEHVKSSTLEKYQIKWSQVTQKYY